MSSKTILQFHNNPWVGENFNYTPTDSDIEAYWKPKLHPPSQGQAWLLIPYKLSIFEFKIKNKMFISKRKFAGDV